MKLPPSRRPRDAGRDRDSGGRSVAARRAEGRLAAVPTRQPAPRRERARDPALTGQRDAASAGLDLHDRRTRHGVPGGRERRSLRAVGRRYGLRSECRKRRPRVAVREHRRRLSVSGRGGGEGLRRDRRRHRARLRPGRRDRRGRLADAAARRRRHLAGLQRREGLRRSRREPLRVERRHWRHRLDGAGRHDVLLARRRGRHGLRGRGPRHPCPGCRHRRHPLDHSNPAPLAPPSGPRRRCPGTRCSSARTTS